MDRGKMDPGLAKKLYQLQCVMHGYEWERDGINRHQQYKYISEAQYKQNFSKALEEVGLIWKMDAFDYQFIDKVSEKQNMVICKFKGELRDPDTGAYEDYFFHGAGADSLDKGYYKAVTGALKFFLASNFNIAENNDPEGEIEVAAPTRPATTEQRAEIRAALTDKKAPASEMQLTALKRALSENPATEAKLLAKIGSLEKLTKEQCEDLLVKLSNLKENQ